MVLMALDHANYFVAQRHPPGEHWGGTFPVYADGLTFLTRWITHLAPTGFMFLLGAGMTLMADARKRRGWSGWRLIRHFWVRGAVLIALQFLVVNEAWKLGPYPFPQVYIGVLVALGGGMILGSLLLQLRAWQLAGLGGLLVLATEWLHPHASMWGVGFDQPLALIFGRSGGDAELWSNYPVLPWLALVLFGMAFGKRLSVDPRRAFGACLALAGALLLAFVVLRSLDGFGNFRPRQGESWIDFLNVVKYPPSMTYILVTLGLDLLALWLLSRAGAVGNWLLKPLVVLGQAPLFFYVIHLFLYGWLGRTLAPSGTTIPDLYPYWALGLLLLLPPTLLFGALKQRQPAHSILRLF